MSRSRVLYVPWWKHIMSIGLMLNSPGIHWQICTKRKPIAIFTNAFCAFKVLSYLPFCICDQIFLKEGGGGEERERMRGREGKGGEAAKTGYVCYLLFFTSHSSYFAT